MRESLEGAVRDGPWLASGPLRPGVRVGAPGAFRIGNAGGEAHPILGEGMSMALQSAALLSSHLIGSDARDGAAASDAVRRRYAADWRREFAPRLRLAAAFAHVAMRPGPSAALMSLARAWPATLTHGARRGGKIRLAIDPAALARPAPAPNSPAPTRLRTGA